MKTLNETGAAFVEFAIVVPLLCLFLTFAVDYGQAFKEHAVMTDACRAAARAAAKPACQAVPTACATQTVRDFLQRSNLDPNSYQIQVNTVNLALPNTGAALAVQVIATRSASSRFLLPFADAFGSRVVSTFRVEMPTGFGG